MAKRRSPAADTVAFFQTAPLEVAQQVLEICQRTVKERMPATRVTKKPRTRVEDGSQALPMGEAAR